jgi:hypothetical protein
MHSNSCFLQSSFCHCIRVRTKIKSNHLVLDTDEDLHMIVRLSMVFSASQIRKS